MASTGALLVGREDGVRHHHPVLSSTSLKLASTDTIIIEQECTTDADAEYQRWRPGLHPMPHRGWLNDPCAPGFDPYSGVYHLGFQWNPDGVEWGNISWGSATSTDLLHWEVSKIPSLAPTTTQDPGGVFTGCMWPSSVDGRSPGHITALYTSARRLPIHYTLPHAPDSEVVCVATSADSGKTWNRAFGNAPVVKSPPSGLDVVGWRDPYVAPWPAVDRLVPVAATDAKASAAGGMLYGILSGGIRHHSPTAFLYRVESDHLDHWECYGPLLCPGLNFSPSPRWAEDFGINWEVTNFVPLRDSRTGLSGDFLICSVEGRKASASDVRVKGEFRATHGQMWLCGSLRLRRNRGTPSPEAESCPVVEMVYEYGGVLDHGALYAANSFYDPLTREQVMFGWVLEDDLPLELRRRQGWAGVISFPRVLRLGVFESVVSGLVTPLGAIGTIGVTPSDKQPASFTVTTLCVLPDPRLRRLRSTTGAVSTESLVLVRPGRWSLSVHPHCAQFELKISFQASKHSERLGFRIFHSDDESTAVYFDPLVEEIIIDRSCSSRIPGVANFNESAPHTLFIFADPAKASNGECAVSREELSFHVYFDHGVLEVFVNERTVITTRVYPILAVCQKLQPFIYPRENSPPAEECFQSELLHFGFWPLEL